MQQGAHDVTHPIIARLYMDRQRQQRDLQDLIVKLEDAARAFRPLHPDHREYATSEDHDAAVDQFYDWTVRIEDLLADLAVTSAAIADSLAGPGSHLTGTPR
jgi:hypothetical protein